MNAIEWNMIGHVMWYNSECHWMVRNALASLPCLRL